MGQSRLNRERRAVRVAFSCAALAFIAGAAFGQALLYSASDGVTVSSVGVIATGTHAAHVSAVVSSASLSDATAPATLSPAAATAVSARATETAQAAPRFVLHYGAIGSDTTGLFTISGHSWKVELHCGTPSEGRSGTSATDVTVRVGIPNGGFTADGLGYQCPVGSPGDTSAGTASATFHDTGVFYLYVDSGASVAWEVIVTDMP